MIQIWWQAKSMLIYRELNKWPVRDRRFIFSVERAQRLKSQHGINIAPNAELFWKPCFSSLLKVGSRNLSEGQQWYFHQHAKSAALQCKFTSFEIKVSSSFQAIREPRNRNLMFERCRNALSHVQDSSYIQQLSIPMAGLTLKTRVFAAVKANNLDKRCSV